MYKKYVSDPWNINHIVKYMDVWIIFMPPASLIPR